MEHDQQSPNRTRDTILVLTLVVFIGGLMLFFLDLVSMGIFTYAVLVAGGVFGLGGLHYLVWGRAMMQEVAAEREALLRAEEEERGDENVEAIQDLSQRRGIRRRPRG
jgi:hypothetical protein